MTLRNADPDLNENSSGSANLGQKIARIGGFPYPYSPPSFSGIKARAEGKSREGMGREQNILPSRDTRFPERKRKRLLHRLQLHCSLHYRHLVRERKLAL